MKEIDEEKERDDLKRKQTLIVGIVALVVICASLLGWWQKTSVGETRVLSKPTTQQTPPVKGPIEICVYVSGMVKHPGVLKLSPGSRAIDAVNAAGGLLPEADVSKVNLSQLLRDGLQVHVPALTAARVATSTGSIPRGKIGAATPTVNVNSADKAELEKLPGIGPALAERIIERRTSQGPFRDGADLKKVPGISESKYAKIKDHITW